MSPRSLNFGINYCIHLLFGIDIMYAGKYRIGERRRKFKVCPLRDWQPFLFGVQDTKPKFRIGRKWPKR